MEQDMKDFGAIEQAARDAYFNLMEHHGLSADDARDAVTHMLRELGAHGRKRETAPIRPKTAPPLLEMLPAGVPWSPTGVAPPSAPTTRRTLPTPNSLWMIDGKPVRVQTVSDAQTRYRFLDTNEEVVYWGSPADFSASARMMTEGERRRLLDFDQA